MIEDSMESFEAGLNSLSYDDRIRLFRQFLIDMMDWHEQTVEEGYYTSAYEAVSLYGKEVERVEKERVKRQADFIPPTEFDGHLSDK